MAKKKRPRPYGWDRPGRRKPRMQRAGYPTRGKHPLEVIIANMFHGPGPAGRKK